MAAVSDSPELLPLLLSPLLLLLLLSAELLSCPLGVVSTDVCPPFVEAGSSVADEPPVVVVVSDEPEDMVSTEDASEASTR